MTSDGQTEEIKNDNLLKIDSTLTINQVAKCYNLWKNFSTIKNLCIDASSVKSIDTAGLQLICYIVNTLRLNNGELAWEPKPSPTFLAQAKLVGMYEFLKLMEGGSS